MTRSFTKIAFTDSVKAAQKKYGSKEIYQNAGDFGPSKLYQKEISFIEQRDSFYLSTVGQNGWPYVQFRGGPKGFLKVLDEATIGYADFRGNLQYISTGNLAADNRAALILLDYPTRRRLKIWARTEILDPAAYPDYMKKISDPHYGAQIERLMIFKLEAFDWNCPQHITPRYTIDEIRSLIKTNPEVLKDVIPLLG